MEPIKPLMPDSIESDGNDSRMNPTERIFGAHPAVPFSHGNEQYGSGERFSYRHHLDPMISRENFAPQVDSERENPSPRRELALTTARWQG